MAHKKDYIPTRDADFDVFFTNLVDYVDQKTGGNVPEWTHIPAPALSALREAHDAWQAAYAATLKPCTKPERDEKNRVRRDSEKTLRDFVNAYLRYYPAVTDYDKEQMGLHIPDTTPTSIPKPTAQPEADAAYPGVHLIELTNIRAVKAAGEDPRSDYGVRIFWGVLGPAAPHDKFRLAAVPVTGDDLPHSTFTHRRRYRFDFSGDSGCTVYFCLRYENEKGGKEGEGPFGPLFSAIIP
jgi:hypothetical protein